MKKLAAFLLSYTRIGTINGYTMSELRTILDVGDSVQVTITLQ